MKEGKVSLCVYIKNAVLQLLVALDAPAQERIHDHRQDIIPRARPLLCGIHYVSLLAVQQSIGGSLSSY